MNTGSRIEYSLSAESYFPSNSHGFRALLLSQPAGKFSVQAAIFLGAEKLEEFMSPRGLFIRL